ncbi:MAG: class I SAM-dependent methyltransferase [Microcella sp.]
MPAATAPRSPAGAPAPRRNHFDAPSVPENYHRYLDPVLFEPWAHRLVRLARLSPGSTVLDVAAGTGAVSRAAAAAVGEAGRVIACDSSARMLDYAIEAASAGRAPIEALVGDATAIGLPDASVDAVLCQQGLPFMADRRATLAECHRVLRPGGVLVVAVWAEGERLDPFDAFADALTADAAAAGAPRTITNAALTMSVADVVDALVGAGLAEVSASRESLPVRWPSLDAELNGLFGTPFGPVVDRFDDDRRAALMRSLRLMLTNGDGTTVDHVTTSVLGRAVKPSRAS